MRGGIMKGMAERRDIHKSWEPLIEQHRHTPEAERPEAVRESVSAHLEEATQQHRAVVAGGDDNQAIPQEPDVAAHAKKLSSLKEPDQVAFLGKIALEEGAQKAVAIAEKSGSPYVVVALHDLLVNELSREIAMK